MKAMKGMRNFARSKSATTPLSVAELESEMMRLLMRQLQQIIEAAELVHQLEGRGMDRVAAEIAEEIGVLFQHHDIDAGARQQQPGHHPGRPTARHAASHRHSLHGISP